MSLEGPLTVTDAKGVRGTIDRRVTPLESAAGASVVVRLEDGRSVSLPARSLSERADGEFYVRANFDELRRVKGRRVTNGRRATDGGAPGGDAGRAGRREHPVSRAA